ncbi:MAG: undecaprenyldiphospho-muramoylpentapeptide beta-N-acetylglucosaminyltransferase [Clostridium sp.]
MKVIISAAGTGGHINPALAIANKIMKNQPNSEIIFIGTDYGMEQELIPLAGYEIRNIKAYGFKKEISFNNFKRIFLTFKSIFDVKKIIKEFKPDIVIGTGGYICVPVIKAALSMKIPTLLHESNAFPGLAIRLYDGKADKILVAFEKTKQFFKHKENLVVSGNPSTIVMKNYTEQEKRKVKLELNLDPNLKTIVIFGGSQGSVKINDAVTEMLIKKIQNHDMERYQIIWATGKDNFDTYLNRFKSKGINVLKIDNLHMVEYIYNMEEVLNIADIAITRAGAMTVTELTKVKLPTIFIPFPTINANKQEENAKIFKDHSAGIIIRNDELTSEILEQKIEYILEDEILQKFKKNVEVMSAEVEKQSNNIEVIDYIYNEIINTINSRKK